MANIDASRLQRICRDVLLKMGASAEEAEIVARHQIGANLAGHDSHGILLLATYVDRIKKGHIVPRARAEIVRETPTTAHIDGHWGFGQVVQTEATRLSINKARQSMMAAVTVAIILAVTFVATIVAGTARDFFSFGLPTARDVGLVAVAVVVWMLLVREAWHRQLVERFLGIASSRAGGR